MGWGYSHLVCKWHQAGVTQFGKAGLLSEGPGQAGEMSYRNLMKFSKNKSSLPWFVVIPATRQAWSQLLEADLQKRLWGHGAQHSLDSISKGLHSRYWKVILPFYSTLVGLHLDCHVQFCACSTILTYRSEPRGGHQESGAHDIWRETEGLFSLEKKYFRGSYCLCDLRIQRRLSYKSIKYLTVSEWLQILAVSTVEFQSVCLPPCLQSV